MTDWLKVRGARNGARLHLDDGAILGRDQPGLEGISDDPELSHRHARVTRTESGRLAIEDLGSTNGTFVNGKRVSGRTELKPGDVVLLGATELEVAGDQPSESRSGRTQPSPATPQTGAPETRLATPVPPPPPQTPPPRPPPPPRAAASPLPPATPPSSRRHNLVPVLVILLVLALAGLVAALLYDGGDDGNDGTAAGEPAYDGTAYVLSNRKGAGQNSVIAIRYGATGFDPLRLREYPTGGSGSSEQGFRGAATDGDQQIQVDSKRDLLFAVNQGSDTVAVFHIRDDGVLDPVKGSPFPSGGTAPISVGLSDAAVLVVNKGYDGIRGLKGPGTVAQFQLREDGSLAPNGQPIRIGPGTGPTQALVIDRADLVVVPALVTGPYHTLSRRGDGTFRSNSTTPVTQGQRALGRPVREALAEALGDPALVPARLPPLPLGALGLSIHPEQDIMYSALPPLSLLMVHSFDQSGRVRFVRAVQIQGGLLACWSAVSPDGRRLYVSNAATHTVAVFDVSEPRNPRQVQLLRLSGGGGHSFNLQIDASGKRLFVLDSFSSNFDRPGLGNQLHVLSIGQGGLLSTPRGSLVRLPVSFDTSSYGLALVPRVPPSQSDD